MDCKIQNMGVSTFYYNDEMSDVWDRSAAVINGSSSYKSGSGGFNNRVLKDISAHKFLNSINKCSFDETGTQAVGTMHTYLLGFIHWTRARTDTVVLVLIRR